MKQDERDLRQEESAGQDTDTTRSQRREAVAPDQTTERTEGAGSNDGRQPQQGTHQEGQYDKRSNQPEADR